MEPNPLDELIRSDEPAAPSPQTVDRLVTGALRRGRRSMIGRRVAAGVAGGALLLTGVAVVGQLPGRGLELGPVAPTATATSTPDPVRPPTVLDVMSVLEPAMPAGAELSEIDTTGAPEGEVAVSFTMTDRAGRAWVGGGIDNEIDDTECDAADGCTRESLGGGTVWVARNLPGEKAGRGTWYSFQRPDGHWVWFGQDNNVSGGNGPVTRPEVPLSEDQVRRLLTAPAWDALVARCVAAGPAC